MTSASLANFTLATANFELTYLGVDVMTKSVSFGQFGLDTPLDKIQTIRLCGAILESDFDVYFPQDAKQVLHYLSKYFGIKYNLGLQEVPLIKDVSILHEEPICRIGSLTKPLIFPHEMITKCKAKWNKERKIRFLFSGLATETRKQSLNSWGREQFGYNDIFLNNQQSSKNLLKRFMYKVNNYRKRRILKDIGLYVVSSKRGREFPIKVWDEEYYNFLADSFFVLCPDGKYTWTYRFFEAILCGAIPIIQNTCKLYDGFNYFSMKDSVNNIIYSDKVAEDNFYKAQKMLTVPRETMNKHLMDILKQN